MLNPFKDVNWHPDTAERRKFARSLIIGFPIIAVAFVLVAWFRADEWNLIPGFYLAGIGAGFGLVFYFVPSIARPFYVVWYALACTIGLIVGNVVLAALYFLVVTPIGLIRRTVSRRAFVKRPETAVLSYWRDAEQPDDSRQYFSQF